jgi:hypothetical protein
MEVSRNEIRSGAHEHVNQTRGIRAAAIADENPLSIWNETRLIKVLFEPFEHRSAS